MKIRLISNGEGPFTRVENADTGELLENVSRISWRVDVGGLAVCQLEVFKVPCDVVSSLVEVKELPRGS